MKLSSLVTAPSRGVSTLISAPARGLKRLVNMVFARNPIRWFNVGRSGFDYRGEVGNGLGSSTVAAPVLWVARTFPEAPPALWRQRENGQEEQLRTHDMLKLLQRPNEYYTGPILWMATTTDWMADGNAYWLKRRSRAGMPVELWWTPSWMIEPRGDETTFITHYEYSVDGQVFRVDPEDVVHFRFGLDPDDPRKGYSPLKSVLAEVFTDDEAARFTATLLRNMGVPGLVISPEKGSPAPSDDDVKATKAYMGQAFSGDRRGEPLIMSGPTQVEQFGFSPEQMLLRELRRIPEERVTAVLGIPAIVAGLGAGLDRSTFTNMAEAREAAYEAGIIPMQRIMGEDVRFQLLPDFGEDPFEWRFAFDLSKVRVLQEDLYRQAQRYDLLIRGGWAMVAEGRRPMGLEVVDERDNIFIRQANTTEVSGDVGGPVRSYGSKAAGQSVNGNGNGATHYEPDEIADAVARLFERQGLVVTK